MSSEEKPHKASKRKLEEARKRGELVTSPEINGIAAFGAIVATLAMLGDQLLDGLKRILFVAIKAVEIRSAEEQTALYDSLQEIVWTLAQILIPISLAGALAATLMGLLQTRGAISTFPLIPKPEKLNPAEGLKLIFSMRKIVETGKSLITVAALTWVVWTLINQMSSTALELGQVTAMDSLAVAITSIKVLLIFSGFVYLVAALLDYAQKYFLFHQQQRMTLEELKREYKESNGDPHVRSKRKALARELANSPIAQKVAQAKVIITNPTHFAVALYYDQDETPLPIVVAKGVDELAAVIRESANASGVPLYEDRALARKLYATVEEGDYISEDVIQAVAAVFAWLAHLEQNVIDA
jgi:type III secretion protein U